MKYKITAYKYHVLRVFLLGRMQSVASFHLVCFFGGTKAINSGNRDGKLTINASANLMSRAVSSLVIPLFQPLKVVRFEP